MDDKSSKNKNKILLATDGSECSAGAVREAISIASRCSSKLTAIEVVVANQEFIAYAPDLLEKQEKDARKRLEAVKAQAAEAGVECDIATHVGDPAYDVIIEELGKSDSELVVMGRRGLSCIARVFMGSVTARVIGHSPADVLVVPRAARLSFKAIMAATDGSEYGGAAVLEGIKFARKCGNASLLVISVARGESTVEAKEALEKAKTIASREGFEIQTQIVQGKESLAHGKASIKILETAKARNIDLIVVSSHGYGELGRILMGSVTERVVGNAECAVLVARAF